MGSSPAQERRVAPPAFDRYLFVDWSARSGVGPATPCRDAVWIGAARRGRPASATYCRTRHQAAALLLDALLAARARGERVLVGFDFCCGFPEGFAAAAGLGPGGWLAAWEAIAAHLTDGPDNRNDRFRVATGLNAVISGAPGPFWGCPPAARSSTLSSRSPGFPFRARSGVTLARLRECERRLPGTQEVWKLLGVGSVGGQSLTGLPRLRALRFHPRLAAHSAVWPFETGFTGAFRAAIVHAEVWPGVVRAQAREQAQRRGLVPDQAQVLALCAWAARLDARGALTAWFERPAGLPARRLPAILAEEGWILGAR